MSRLLAIEAGQSQAASAMCTGSLSDFNPTIEDPYKMARIVQGFLRSGLAFLKRDEGLVAVEWVAMSAAVSVGAIAVVWMVMNTLGSTATGIGGNIAGANSGSCANAAFLTTASC